MKTIYQENITRQKERINFLLEELNATLDLYYDKAIDNEVNCQDHDF